MRSAGGRWVGALLAAGLLLAAACGGGDDDDKSKDSDEPTDDKPAEVAEVVDPYDGHTSDIYDGTTNWLCHPDLDEDECSDLSATSVDAAGNVERADLEPADDPAIDCFYVYPTVSLDASDNSDLVPDEQERSTVGAQAAPFATTCRVFAPVYRQVTVTALRSGARDPAAWTTAYGDALDAWKTYISQYNDGRGFILIGHSQGTGILTQLIADEIDTNPDLRSRLVSAVLMGGAVAVPDGEDVGGSFKEIPACGAADDIGCVITFSSYPAASPPGEGAIFGRPGFGPSVEADPGQRALCVDPVALAGGNGLADSIVPTKAPLIGAGDQSAAASEGIDTRYIVLPEMLKAGCERTGDYDYFAAGPASDDDTRQVALQGLLAERLGPTWGLHLQDSSLAMGDLLEIAAKQADAYTT